MGDDAAQCLNVLGQLCPQVLVGLQSSLRYFLQSVGQDWATEYVTHLQRLVRGLQENVSGGETTGKRWKGNYALVFPVISATLYYGVRLGRFARLWPLSLLVEALGSIDATQSLQRELLRDVQRRNVSPTKRVKIGEDGVCSSHPTLFM